MSEGWTGAVPTTALVIVASGPHLDSLAEHSDWATQLESALDQRCKDRHVWSWQRDVWRWTVELAFRANGRLGVDPASAQAISTLNSTHVDPSPEPETLGAYLQRIRTAAGDSVAIPNGVGKEHSVIPAAPPPGLSALACLDHILSPGVGAPMNGSWGIKNGRVVLATGRSPTVLDVYDTRDLLDCLWAGQWYDRTPGRAPSYEERLELGKNVIDLVTGFVRSEQWVDNGGDTSSIRMLNDRLLIDAPPTHHVEVQGLLSMLRAPAAKDHVVHLPRHDQNIALLARLDTTIIELPAGPITLGQLLMAISDQTCVRVVGDWEGLKPLEIKDSTSCRLGARRTTALDALKRALSPTDGRCRVMLSPRADCVVIEPRCSLGSEVIVYDLADFLQFKESFKPDDDLYKNVRDIVSGLVETESWVENGGDEASMRMFDTKLVIKAPLMEHYQVQRLLAMLRAGRDARRLKAINAAEAHR
jgi:hypothetical protein